MSPSQAPHASHVLREALKLSYKMLWIEIDNSVLTENRLGFGQRPALLLIDLVLAYTSPSSSLFAPGMLRASSNSAELLLAARQACTPIVHAHTKYFAPDLSDGGLWLKKKPAMKIMQDGNFLTDFCQTAAPIVGEPIIAKQFPSAFFATNLDTSLRARGIDTIVLAGGPTSASVRATAVDGIQHGYHVIVVRECVGDVCPDAHRASLSDIDYNYGDVISREDAVKAFSLRI
jgi:maleamate amidohydrolase